MASEFTWRGKVRGQPRPRAFARGGHAGVYRPSWAAEYEAALAAAYVGQGGEHYGAVPVSVEIEYGRALPKSRPRSVESEADLCKPDVDNVAKAVLDALSGVAYDDDRQVCRLAIGKAPRSRGGEWIHVKVEPLSEGLYVNALFDKSRHRARHRDGLQLG